MTKVEVETKYSDNLRKLKHNIALILFLMDAQGKKDICSQIKRNVLSQVEELEGNG